MRYLSLAALALVAAVPASAQLAPPNAAGVTYGHVHLTVAEMDVHTALWQEHFGAQIVTKGPLTVAKIPNMHRLPGARPHGAVPGQRDGPFRAQGP
jgi:hypothetical protein